MLANMARRKRSRYGRIRRPYQNPKWAVALIWVLAVLVAIFVVYALTR